MHLYTYEKLFRFQGHYLIRASELNSPISKFRNLEEN